MGLLIIFSTFDPIILENTFLLIVSDAFLKQSAVVKKKDVKKATPSSVIPTGSTIAFTT